MVIILSNKILGKISANPFLPILQFDRPKANDSAIAITILALKFSPITATMKESKRV